MQRKANGEKGKRPLFCLPLLLSLLAGCAVFNADNRLALNQLDDWIQPETTASRIALAPAAVPLGTVAGAADMVLIHPVCVIPDAAEDVYDLYWKPREMDFLRQALLIPLFVVLTPPTFVGDWLVRSLFDVRW
jgi:hypothetical protein